MTRTVVRASIRRCTIARSLTGWSSASNISCHGGPSSRTAGGRSAGTGAARSPTASASYRGRLGRARTAALGRGDVDHRAVDREHELGGAAVASRRSTRRAALLSPAAPSIDLGADDVELPGAGQVAACSAFEARRTQRFTRSISSGRAASALRSSAISASRVGSTSGVEFGARSRSRRGLSNRVLIASSSAGRVAHRSRPRGDCNQRAWLTLASPLARQSRVEAGAEPKPTRRALMPLVSYRLRSA